MGASLLALAKSIYLHVRLKTMAHFIKVAGELGHNEMYIHIVF